MPAILKPLSDAGLVQFVGKKGDKRSLYSILDSEKASALERFASDLSLSGVVPDAIFEQTFASIVEQLKNKELSKDQRARTLEVLAAKICWRLGLRHIQIRNRTEFEVDVVADRTGPGYYQRWLVQCKAYGNASIRSEHILREFGIASLVGYDAILFVTTSTYSDDAIKVISNIIRKTNLLLLPISGADLQAFAENEPSLLQLLESRSHDARRTRLGANPVEVFRELDAMKDVLLKDKPVPADVWLRLERRQIHMEFDVFLPTFATWLESQRGTEGFDEDYLTAVRSP
jgi:hypothetical protein